MWKVGLCTSPMRNAPSSHMGPLSGVLFAPPVTEFVRFRLF